MVLAIHEQKQPCCSFRQYSVLFPGTEKHHKLTSLQMHLHLRMDHLQHQLQEYHHCINEVLQEHVQIVDSCDPVISIASNLLAIQQRNHSISGGRGQTSLFFSPKQLDWFCCPPSLLFNRQEGRFALDVNWLKLEAESWPPSSAKLQNMSR